MPDMVKRAREVADDLIGTARDISEFASTEEINNQKFCCELDAIIFSCELCGWWCSVDELQDESGNDHCNDCHVDYSEEE